MNIRNYLDSTYLKTALQAGISEIENKKIALACTQEAINEKFKLVMIRPEYVQAAKEIIVAQNSDVLVGTVIGFHEGTATVHEKLNEAKKAIDDGVDELDYVVNFEAFKKGDTNTVKDEILQGTKLGLQHHKTVKWIIETAALDTHQIIQLSTLIKNVIISHFKESDYEKVFVKSSTGFYKTPEGMSNGATIEGITAMLENAFPLPVKASGGVRNLEDTMIMIQLGVKRIGTSNAKTIVDGLTSTEGY